MSSVKVGPLIVRPMLERGEDPQGRMYYRIYYNRKPIKNLGWATEEEAVRFAAKLIETDGYIGTEKPTTLGEVIKQWAHQYKERIDLADGSKQTSTRAMRHVSRIIGKTKIDSIDQSVIDHYRDQRLKEGGAPSTIITEYRRLTQAWKWAKGKFHFLGVIPPLTVVEYRTYNHRTPTDQEIDRVVQEMKSWMLSRSRWASIFVLIGYYTGARSGEIGRLRWSDVSFEGSRITFRRKRTIGARRSKEEFLQTVPVPAELLQALEEWKESVPSEPGDRLLGISRESVHATIGDRINRACQNLEIEPFTPHGLRRACVRRFRRKGVPVVVSAAYLSHSPAVMMRLYDEVSEEDLSEAVIRVYEDSTSEDTVSAPVSQPAEKDQENPRTLVRTGRPVTGSLMEQNPGETGCFGRSAGAFETFIKQEESEIFIDWGDE